MSRSGVLIKTGSVYNDLACLLENINYQACLLTSGLNDIFHLSVHSDIFCRSLFNTSAGVLLSCTTKNQELSAKSFTIDFMFSDKSLMYIKRKEWTKTKPLWHTCFYRQALWSLAIE